MLSKKLTSLLASFSKIELTQFKKYLLSPYFNESETLLLLFEQIEQQLRQNQNCKALQKEQVWTSLFKDTAFNDAQLRRICSDLTKLAYHFLSLKKDYKSPLDRSIHLLEIFHDRKLEKHFMSTIKQSEEQARKSKEKGANYHYKKYQLERFRHLNYEQSGEKIDTFENLQQSDYHLECFFIIHKLKHYCDALGYRIFLAMEAEIDLPPGFLEYLEQKNFLQEANIKAYYLVAKMLMHTEEERYFYQLKELLKSQASEFSKEELNTLYIHLNNYCIQEKINIGKSEYFVELFDNFRMLLEQDIMLKNGELVPQDYKNIITVGLHIKEFDWVEDFIQQYTPKLPKDNQENALTYNLAKVYFAQQKYEKVIEQLREVEYQNLFYALGGKLMLLKTYYELKEFLALDSLIDSFRIYLRRNKLISKDVKQKYLNVLRFVKKLSNTTSQDKAAIDKIKKQINECKALADKNWILEKIKELEQSKIETQAIK